MAKSVTIDLTLEDNEEDSLSVTENNNNDDENNGRKLRIIRKKRRTGKVTPKVKKIMGKEAIDWN